MEDGSETLSAVAAIRLLMLTGCRLSEFQKLRWEHVHLDARELRPRNSKTGAKVVHVGDPAIAVLREIDRQYNSPWVIAGRKPGSHLTDLQHPWRSIRARAGLEDVRIQNLRHSYASTALQHGETVLTIGRLLGHGHPATTLKYTHSADATVREAVEVVGVVLEG